MNRPLVIYNSDRNLLEGVGWYILFHRHYHGPFMEFIEADRVAEDILDEEMSQYGPDDLHDMNLRLRQSGI
jgi:hypothetical protein